MAKTKRTPRTANMALRVDISIGGDFADFVGSACGTVFEDVADIVQIADNIEDKLA